jgi:O-acetyl-ADP-ribose deacetylase (regulator of RNase III)
MKQNTSIQIVKEDILSINDIEAIVNPSNNSLSPGGGLSGIIYKAAGPKLAQFTQKLGSIKTGSAVMTPGFSLKKHIIHTAGPNFFEDDSEKRLTTTYKNVLAVAMNNGIKKIAIPAISAGVYGFPADISARIAIGAVKEFLETNHFFEKVILVLHEEKLFDEYQKLLNPPVIN